ncbi:MAG: hypothetical protein KGO51_05195 [Alphaproteobacteria bacterium]|nr:hypothetical protein [Alphaproteobacteria bacterium]
MARPKSISRVRPVAEAAPALPNGPGAAAILAAGVGSLALGLFALAGDAWPALGNALSVWPPTGPLSGVTAAAVVVWLVAWAALGRIWARREVNLRAVNLAAFAMLAAGLLLTFPPIMDLLEGR